MSDVTVDQVERASCLFDDGDKGARCLGRSASQVVRLVGRRVEMGLRECTGWGAGDVVAC
jgi:hypothetical protein